LIDHHTVWCSFRREAVLALLVCGALGTARADDDGRPGDRFFFGMFGGATDGGGAGGYEVSAWPNDYIGITAGTSVVTAGPTATTPESTGFEYGAMFVGAIPLRYIQPYAGGWGGFIRTALAGEGTGFHTDLHPVLGVNAYVSRNLRLYVQWRPVTIHRDIEGMEDPDTDLYAVGVRWSPDAFHRAKSINKLDLVWGSVSFSALLWLFINLWQHGDQSASGQPAGSGGSP
jgi:hypothetical protein